MGLFDGILDREQSGLMYRTVDGGHPAPFPDMTDEQLYNYERAFHVPHRTFEAPPAGRQAPRASDSGSHEPTGETNRDPQRLRRNKAFDAPRYIARKARSAVASPQQGQRSEIKLDLSKPVRLVTTKQPVEIITTRARHPVYKVHAYIGDDDVVTVFTLDGRMTENGAPFLENVPEQRALFLNLYPALEPGHPYRITQHASRAEADAEAATDPVRRLVCVPVQLDDATRMR